MKREFHVEYRVHVRFAVYDQGHQYIENKIVFFDKIVKTTA